MGSDPIRWIDFAPRSWYNLSLRDLMTGSCEHPASHPAASAAGRTYAFSYRVWRFS